MAFNTVKFYHNYDESIDRSDNFLFLMALSNNKIVQSCSQEYILLNALYKASSKQFTITRGVHTSSDGRFHISGKVTGLQFGRIYNIHIYVEPMKKGWRDTWNLVSMSLMHEHHKITTIANYKAHPTTPPNSVAPPPDALPMPSAEMLSVASDDDDLDYVFEE